jgi:mannose PTS system EIIA component
MINLILISHGSYAAGLREAAEMILGEQENLEVFGVFPGDTVEIFSEKLEKAIENFNDPAHTLILADLPGGTPSNTAMMMVLKHKVHALVGTNLPMLIDILSMRSDMEMDELKEEALTAAKDGIIDANALLSER